MRINLLLAAIFALILGLSVAASAAEEESAAATEGAADSAAEDSGADSRRPKLKMSTREDVPYDLGNSGRFDSSVGMQLGDSDWEEYYFQQLNLSAFMGRLKTVLTDPQYFGGQEELATAVKWLEDAGIFNYANCVTEYSISGNDITYRASSSFTPFAPGSLQARSMAIADEAPVTSKYVRPDQYLMYISIPNFYEMTMLQLEEAVRQHKALEEDANPQMSELLGEMDLGQLEEMLAVMKVMGVDKIIDDSLTGELAIVIYEIENLQNMSSGDVSPQDFDVALLLGMKDGAYLEKLSGTYGPELGLKQLPDQDGWKVFAMQDEQSVGMFYNGELLALTPDMPEVMANVRAASSGALNAPPCQFYFDLNLSRLDAEIVGPVTQMALAEAGTDEDFDTVLRSMAYLLDKPVAEQLGHITMMSSQPGGSSQATEFRLTKPALRYAAFHLLAAIGAVASNEEWLEELDLDGIFDELGDMAGSRPEETVASAGSVK